MGGQHYFGFGGFSGPSGPRATHDAASGHSVPLGYFGYFDLDFCSGQRNLHIQYPAHRFGSVDGHEPVFCFGIGVGRDAQPDPHPDVAGRGQRLGNPDHPIVHCSGDGFFVFPVFSFKTKLERFVAGWGVRSFGACSSGVHLQWVGSGLVLAICVGAGCGIGGFAGFAFGGLAGGEKFV